jgi:hypothetical protein
MRKTIVLAVALALGAVGLAGATSSPQVANASITAVCDNGPRVFVYEHANFSGDYKYFCGYTNVPNLWNVGFPGYCQFQNLTFTGSWADCISSYRSFGMTGHWLCFYTNSNYSGNKEGYGANASVPQVTWNDAHFSIRWKTSAC